MKERKTFFPNIEAEETLDRFPRLLIHGDSLLVVEEGEAAGDIPRHAAQPPVAHLVT